MPNGYKSLLFSNCIGIRSHESVQVSEAVSVKNKINDESLHDVPKTKYIQEDNLMLDDIKYFVRIIGKGGLIRCIEFYNTETLKYFR